MSTTIYQYSPEASVLKSVSPYTAKVVHGAASIRDLWNSLPHPVSVFVLRVMPLADELEEPKSKRA
jgi:hypothetical protein